MSGLSDRVTNVDKLKAEIRRLVFELEHERREKGAMLAELARLQSWTEKIVGPAFGGLYDVVHDLKVAVERTGSKVMADLQTLADLVTQARGDAAAEAQEVKSKLDEQTALIQQLQQNQNDPARVDAIATELAGLQSDIRSIFTGEAPPTPEPTPEPAPGGRRR